MVLIFPVLGGFVAGVLRAWRKQQWLHLPTLHSIWLVILAFLPQLVVFYLRKTYWIVPDNWSAFILVSSQLALLLFVWHNCYQQGMWILGLGVFLNLLVIGMNGGLMPISPETVESLYPNVPVTSWEIGDRWIKSIIIPVSETRLWWLSDCILFPSWLPWNVAFSVGDAFIAWGVFKLLWSIGQDDVDHNNSVASYINSLQINNQLIPPEI